MRIARVFPSRTNQTPSGPDVYDDAPPTLFPLLHYDEVHISVTFTWDIPRAEYLLHAWQDVHPNVRIGGPAMGTPAGEFTPGMYLKPGAVITSRGCPHDCWFCYVPKREGKLRELKIHPGHLVQDNNLLACSKQHLDRVFTMLRTQSKIEFSGGLEAALVTDNIAEQLRSLKIDTIFLANDSPDREDYLARAISRLRKHFKRRYIRVYTLIGYPKDTLEAAEARLLRAWELGGMPFAMRYRDDSGIYYPERPWTLLTTKYIQPRYMKKICEVTTGIKE